MAKIDPGDVEVTTEVVQRVRRRSIADTHESPLKDFMTEISTESGTPTKNKKDLALDLKVYISSVLEASVTQRIMMTATAFSLVGDDLKDCHHTETHRRNILGRVFVLFDSVCG
jgi:hypothetical protein